MHTVRIFDRDPDLLGTLSTDRAHQVRQRVDARAASVAVGRCKDTLYGLKEDGPLGLLILGGFLLRRVRVHDRRSIEVLGPTDLSRPWVEGEDYSLPVDVEWEAATEVEVALIDHGVVRATGAAAPSVADVLADRLIQRSRWLALELAIASIRGVDARLLLTLWHLADRWGSVTADGVRVPVRLTHETFSEIVGARRPSVSTAFGVLSERGLISRLEVGWLLRGPPPIDLPSLDREAVVTD